MLASNEEGKFLMSHLLPSMRVLEYGSGGSTIEIAKQVQQLVSIEHDPSCYDHFKKIIPNNVNYILKQPKHGWESNQCKALSDGTEEHFKEYIEAPLELGPFDIIFIDGRARRDCAFMTPKMSKNGTVIFMHDFSLNPPVDRKNYLDCLKILSIVSNVGTMYKFIIKI